MTSLLDSESTLVKELPFSHLDCLDCQREKNRKISFEGKVYQVCGSCPHAINLKRQLFTPEPMNKETVCPVCKTTIEQIESTSLVGCPNCYDIFDENIRVLLSHN
jgi:protein-arginine kinase activator protein McsA